MNKTTERDVARINEFLIDSVNKPVEQRGTMKAVVEKGERKHEARFASAETSGLCNTNRRRVNRGDNRRETKQKREHNTVAVASIVRVASYAFIGFIYRGSERITPIDFSLCFSVKPETQDRLINKRAPLHSQ